MSSSVALVILSGLSCSGMFEFELRSLDIAIIIIIIIIISSSIICIIIALTISIITFQINKPLIEKRRRARINDCLVQLKTIVLEAQESQVSTQTDAQINRQTDKRTYVCMDGRTDRRGGIDGQTYERTVSRLFDNGRMYGYL